MTKPQANLDSDSRQQSQVDGKNPGKLFAADIQRFGLRKLEGKTNSIGS